tara:strand:+ start:504 stop:2405 length:1902 start_codon:yes stop_codon:yes gene_type:complete
MYGLDANIIQPPFSAIISILLILACDYIGITVVSRLLKINTFNIKWMRWQAPIIGAALLSVIVYPVALLGGAFRGNLRILAITLIAISFLHIFNLIKLNFHLITASFYKRDAGYSNIIYSLIIILVVGYALLALGPVTSADSLNYHIGVSIEILNTGVIFGTPEWFHSRLSGNGEVLNALGLSVGAEQFGSLLQFTGLLGVIGLFLGVDGNESGENLNATKDFRALLTLVILSSPLLLFLVLSSKFQLLPISMTTLALCLIVYPSRRNLDPSDSIKNFLLICLLVMVASQSKINYLLSGGILGLIAISLMFYKRLIWQSILIGVLAALLILVPVIIIKSEIYGSGFIETILSPLPGNSPGIDLFEIYIRNAQESKIIFPFSLFIPSRIGLVTTIIGFGVFSFVFLRPRNNNWVKIILLSLGIVFLITMIYGPSSSRSYMEPYLWCLIAILLQKNNILYIKNIKILVIFQSLIVASMCWYGVISLFPGAISPSLRDNVMSSAANGYTLMKWVDKTLPKSAIVLSSHRSISLIPRKTISLDWMDYIKTGEINVSNYLDRIKEEEVTHLLIWDQRTFENTEEYARFSKCFGDKIYGPEEDFIAVRNPFNKRLSRLNAWIVEFDSKKLPHCFDSSSW